jgi:hypothetical protein
MADEPRESTTQQSLRTAASDFEVCARRAVECMLGVPTYSPRGFGLSSRPGGGNAVVCTIQADNSGYSASLTLGIDAGDLKDLIPAEDREEEIRDALGEISNVIAGTFLGRPIFRNAFGSMLPSPPIFRAADFREESACCIEGTLKAKGAKLFLGFTVKPNGKDAPK